MRKRPKGRGSRRSSHQSAASKATAGYRRSHRMPKGTQVQHWTKVLSAKETGMDTARMNRNLSPLQSRKGLKATTLLQWEKVAHRPGIKRRKELKQGTEYTVHDRIDKRGELSTPKQTYRTEHKFADRHLIPAEADRIRKNNPRVNRQDMHEAAGASARWKMTGAPGNVPKNLVRTVDLARGERFQPPAKDRSAGKPARRPAKQSSQFASNADPRAVAEWNKATQEGRRTSGFSKPAGQRASSPDDHSASAGRSSARSRGRSEGFPARARPPSRPRKAASTDKGRRSIRRSQGFAKPAVQPRKSSAVAPNPAARASATRNAGFSKRSAAVSKGAAAESRGTDRNKTVTPAQQARFDKVKSKFNSVLRQGKGKAGSKSAGKKESAAPGGAKGKTGRAQRTAGGGKGLGTSRVSKGFGLRLR